MLLKYTSIHKATIHSACIEHSCGDLYYEMELVFITFIFLTFDPIYK